MIFAARGLLVSLAFFATLYCPLSLISLLIWRGISRRHRKPGRSSANFLYGVRILPFFLTAVVTVFLTFPSFWMFERPSLDEDAETFVLAVCALVILGAGLFRLLRTHAKTTRIIAEWAKGTTSLDNNDCIPRLSASSGAPPLVLVGIRKPRVMVSDAVRSVLNESEFQVAVRHELGHKRSWDNLKKFLVSAVPFPGMNSLERAWREAAELAADDAAVTNRQEALDLAAALIKLSRFPQPSPEPVLVTGLVSGACSISLRVERLLEWRTAAHRPQHAWPLTLLVLFTIILSIVGNYGTTLALTHRLTELLVP